MVDIDWFTPVNRFRLAEEETTLPSMVTLFYRTRDYLNDEFWEASDFFERSGMQTQIGVQM